MQNQLLEQQDAIPILYAYIFHKVNSAINHANTISSSRSPLFKISVAVCAKMTISDRVRWLNGSCANAAATWTTFTGLISIYDSIE